MSSTQIVKMGSLGLCAAAMVACSGGGDPTGTVSVSLMDRPVDGITALYVTISEVWLKPKGDGPAFQLAMTTTPLTVNLLELDDQNASVLVDEAVVPAGSYNWIEFKIEDEDINDSHAMTTAGGIVPVDVDVPSGKLRLVSGFEVGENQAARFLFDWDVRKGLTEAVGQNVLLLRPAFRILRVDEYGSISGSIDSTHIVMLPMSNTCVSDPLVPGKVVYVFDGHLTVLDDMDGTAPDPSTTADAVFNPDSGNWDYRVAVMPGDYTLAFTCEGDLDTDAASEALTFYLPAAGDSVSAEGFVTVTAATPIENVDF